MWRRLVYSGAGLVSLAAGQAATFGLTYESPPDCRGPRRGIEYADGSGTVLPAVAPAVAPPALAARLGRDDADEGVVGADGLAARCGAAAVSAAAALTAAATVGAVPSAPRAEARAGARAPAALAAASAADESNASAAAPRRRLLLFVGDSLVTGVGCACANADPGARGAATALGDGVDASLCTRCGPTLPRRMASRLAHTVQAPVEWRVFGLTGASVAELRARVLPRLREAHGAQVEAVVIVCGVNDWKRAWMSYSPRAFGRRLAALVDHVRVAVGDSECRVILPAVSGDMMHEAPRFRVQPLRAVLAFVAERYDDAKRRVALSAVGGNVEYVRAMPATLTRAVGRSGGADSGGEAAVDRHFFSRADGVHPSTVGYARWADWIFECIVPGVASGGGGGGGSSSVQDSDGGDGGGGYSAPPAACWPATACGA